MKNLPHRPTTMTPISSFHTIPDLLFTLYLLIYSPLTNLRRSRSPVPPKPELSPLPSYWRQGRFVLALLGVLMLVSWLGGHNVHELGLGIPPPRGGLIGLAFAACLLLGMHMIGTRMERKSSAEDCIEQEARLGELAFSMPRTGIETIAYLITMIGMTTAWELLYRAYLLLVLTPVTGMPLAVVLAAVAYGVGHGDKNAKQTLASIAAALAFTIGYAVTGSLWWLIVLHAAAPIAVLSAARKIKPKQAPTGVSADIQTRTKP